MQEGRRWNFFSFKSAWIFACAFQLSSTTFPCIFFLPGLHFASEKNKDKIFKHAQWTQQNRTRAFQPEKRYRRMFFYLIEKHMQKFGPFWRKKISPEKVTYVPLASSHSIVYYQVLVSNHMRTQANTNNTKIICTVSTYKYYNYNYYNIITI